MPATRRRRLDMIELALQRQFVDGPGKPTIALLQTALEEFRTANKEAKLVDFHSIHIRFGTLDQTRIGAPVVLYLRHDVALALRVAARCMHSS